MINTLSTVLEKSRQYHKDMGNVSRDTEILRRNQKKMLEIKIALTEMKNTSDGLIRLNMTLG